MMFDMYCYLSCLYLCRTASQGSHVRESVENDSLVKRDRVVAKLMLAVTYAVFLRARVQDLPKSVLLKLFAAKTSSQIQSHKTVMRVIDRTMLLCAEDCICSVFRRR